MWAAAATSVFALLALLVLVPSQASSAHETDGAPVCDGVPDCERRVKTLFLNPFFIPTTAACDPDQWTWAPVGHWHGTHFTWHRNSRGETVNNQVREDQSLASQTILWEKSWSNFSPTPFLGLFTRDKVDVTYACSSADRDDPSNHG